MYLVLVFQTCVKHAISRHSRCIIHIYHPSESVAHTGRNTVEVKKAIHSIYNNLYITLSIGFKAKIYIRRKGNFYLCTIQYLFGYIIFDFISKPYNIQNHVMIVLWRDLYGSLCLLSYSNRSAEHCLVPCCS